MEDSKPAAVDDANPPAKKKRRVEQETAESSTGAASTGIATGLVSFDIKVLYHIFSFLAWRDLNEVACTSKRCNEIRKSKLLDQTHEAIISCLPPSSRAQGRHGSQIPTNHNRLVIENFQNIQGSTSIVAPQQEHVTHLTIKGQGNGHACIAEAFFGLQSHFPNVVEARLINLDFGRGASGASRQWARQWPRLSRLDCRNTVSGGIMDPRFGGFKDLKELNLDGATITETSNLFHSWLVLYGVRNTLEKLSCVNCGLADITTHGTIKAIHMKEALKLFVRSAPKLRWFRTDLIGRDIADLRMKHPNITFVSPNGSGGGGVSAGSIFDAH